jgi:sensor c-di-GMP phosphodiesterase-like protein
MNMLAPIRAHARIEERLTSLFLSATVRDMGDYRAKVPEWTRHLNINVNPQKYWSGGAEPIEELCTRRISSCSGYSGVFG